MSNGPIDLSRTPIHLPDAAAADAVPLTDFHFDGPSFEGYIDTHCGDVNPGRLMMIESTPVSWPSWERHPEGTEIVHVLEGSGTFYQEIDGAEHAIPFSAGSTIINPPNVWHTADVDQPMKALYITPCPGTEGKPR